MIFSDPEISAAQSVIADLSQDRLAQGVHRLQILREECYAAIPEKKRQSQGITWVLQHISDLLVEACDSEEQFRQIALRLWETLPPDDRLLGVPIFLMGAYGKAHPTEVLSFFETVADSSDWVVREFAQAGLRQLICPNREVLLPWLMKTAQSPNPNLRRLVSETLRPVTDNHWMNREPEYPLSVLRLLFHEKHAYPRTSVGNNLSDLSRRNPELIFEVVKELVETGDPNSYWIANRACRNLVKKDPLRVMDLLGVDEYHYKDRHYIRE
jgi:3-methyladenine DNA glycosylase AlkC